MASAAQTLETLAQSLGYDTLNHRDLLLCLAGLYSSSAGLTAQQAVVQCAAQGYARLSDNDLQQCILYVLQ